MILLADSEGLHQPARMPSLSACAWRHVFAWPGPVDFYFYIVGCSTADYWLCGNTFTTADLHVTILLLRINLLGLDERYISSKRPHLCEYRDRLMERPPAKKLKQAPQLMKKAFMKRTMTIAAKYALKAGVVVAVVGTGFFIYRKYFRQWMKDRTVYLCSFVLFDFYWILILMVL